MPSNIAIKHPLITEKSLQATAKNRFTFKVSKNATKPQIKQTIEEIFKVHVEAVHTSIVMPKAVRTRKSRHIATASSWKKAIVTLKSGEKIDLFDIKTS